MNTARSCVVTSVRIDDVEYDFIPYGQETRFGWNATVPSSPYDTRCHDCGVLLGGFHHAGCDMAECPRCHGQLLTCECLGQPDDDSDEPRYFDWEQHPVSSRWAVFEDNQVTGYLYLTPPAEQRPIADCWLYNVVEAPSYEEAKRYAEQGGAPPASIGYTSPDARYDPSTSPHIRFIWSRDGESVAAEVDGVVLGFITLDDTQAESYSRNLNRDGEWGNTWDERLYRSLFKRR